MATITTAQKNEMVKVNGFAAITLPEDAIQYGDFSYAIPVTAEGEQRYLKLVGTSASNKDTKTTHAFDPEAEREDWISEKAFKAKKAEEDKKAKSSKSKTKSKAKVETVDEEVVG